MEGVISAVASKFLCPVDIHIAQVKTSRAHNMFKLLKECINHQIENKNTHVFMTSKLPELNI